MITWLTDTVIGKMTMTFLISMLPVVELRLGLPYGVAIGLNYPQAVIAAVLGNLLPVPFIILFIKNILSFLRAKFEKMDGFITRIEERAHLKSEVVQKYGMIGLCLLVAIPLPGTGAWTGALVAALMGMKLKRAMPVIIIGVLIAAAIMLCVTLGAIHLF